MSEIRCAYCLETLDSNYDHYLYQNDALVVLYPIKNSYSPVFRIHCKNINKKCLNKEIEVNTNYLFYATEGLIDYLVKNYTKETE